MSLFIRSDLMTPGPWYTDGLVVWAHSAGGPGICAARNLSSDREGTFAPVTDLAEQAANMAACAAVPALVDALKLTRIDYVRALEAAYGPASDPLDVLVHGDPALKRIDDALALLDKPAPPP